MSTDQMLFGKSFFYYRRSGGSPGHEARHGGHDRVTDIVSAARYICKGGGKSRQHSYCPSP
jgi:hypothetical protein